MSILLIAVSFLLTLANIYVLEKKIAKRKTGKFRIAFIKTAIIYGIIITLLTEILSVWRSLNFTCLIIFWGIFLIVSLVVTKPKFIQRTYSDFINQTLLHLKCFELKAAIAILGICLVTAIMAPPNNWDVMTYHMPRVMHWVQNQSIAHYPANNTRQISFPGGAGYIVAQFQILTGTNLLANCVQWLAFFGSIIGTSLITNALVGVSKQWVGALVCATIPMAIMQSTTAQTDLVVSFWLVSFTYFIFRTDRYTKSDLFWLAASIGLAILTKPTALIFGFPLGIVFLIRSFRSHVKIIPKDKLVGLIKISCQAIALLIGSLLLSVPSFWRNFQTFGSFLGSDGNNTRNDVLGLPHLVSNALKNLGINLPIPGLWSVIKSIHESVLQINLNDPRLNFTDISKYITTVGALRFLSPNEDFVGSPIHWVLFLLTIFGLIAALLKRKNIPKASQDLQMRMNPDSNISTTEIRSITKTTPDLSALILLGMSVIVSFLIYCFLLKWQAWGNRLLLPLVVLASTAIAYFLTDIVNPKSKKIMILLLTTTAIFYSLTTMKHPLVSLPVITAEQGKEQSQSILFLKRQDIYFSGVKKELKIPYQTAADLVNQTKCKYVGFSLGYDDIEYPFWQLLEPDIKIKNVNVNNLSNKIEPAFPDQKLCTIISTLSSFSPIETTETAIRWQGLNVSQDPYVMVYKKLSL
jgi:4-amino-4-deoxy-L-arabinose transferase-like glycosyltransferase